MAEYKLIREEQETIIRGTAASQEWEIVTAEPRTIRRIEKQKPPNKHLHLHVVSAEVLRRLAKRQGDEDEDEHIVVTSRPQ